MYSKNDYRYYLENQLTHSDDFLAHYGVKGMKWKQHKAKGDPERVGTNIAIGAYETNVDGRTALLDQKQKVLPNDAQIRGKKLTNKIKSQQTIKADQSRGRAKTEQYKGKSSEYLRERESNSKKNNFPTSKKKKSNRRPFTIESLRRVKPKGRKLRGGGNITVIHN